MAKQRYIKPKFWSDAYIQELDANTKLLYLYLMTNEHNNIAWIYEITEKTMCFEISYPSNTLSKGIDKLSKDWKIIYIDWWMILKNHVKNQNTKSQTVKDWIKRIISELPPSIRDRVCIGYIGDSIYLDFNLDFNLDLNPPKKLEDNDIKDEYKKTNTYTNDFEIFWKKYPHARKWKKAESLKYFKNLNVDEIMQEVNILNWKVNLWLENSKYIPACERWIRDFTITSDNIKEQDIENIVNALMEMDKWDKRKEYWKKLSEDFGKENINQLVKKRNQNKNWITLNFK